MSFFTNKIIKNKSFLKRISDQIVPAIQGYVNTILSDTPLAYWRLNEISPSGASSVIDISGNNNNATPNGASFQWDQFGCLGEDTGASVKLNGAENITGGASLASTLMLSSEWSIELWFYRIVGAASGYLFSAAADSTHRVAISLSSTGTIYTTSDIGGDHSSEYGNITGAWHHLVLNSDGTLYIDGILQAGTGDAGLNSTNQITIGSLQSNTSYFIGKIAEVAIYQNILSQSRVSAHFEAGCVWTIPTGRTFYWDMETETPNVFPPGGDITPKYSPFVTRTTSQAYEGSYSLSFGGDTFESATFDNPTPYDKWCSLSEGSVSLWFRYSGTITNLMLFQITGKDETGVNDTNDSVKATFTSSGIVLNANGTSISTSQTLSPDTWYYVICKFKRTGGGDTLSISCNGSSATSTTVWNAPTCTAWHQILIGNDLPTNPSEYYIDNFEIYGSWI